MLGVQPGHRFLHRGHPLWRNLGVDDDDTEFILFQTKEKADAGISSVAVTSPNGIKFIENGLCEYFRFSLISCLPCSYFRVTSDQRMTFSPRVFTFSPQVDFLDFLAHISFYYYHLDHKALFSTR